MTSTFHLLSGLLLSDWLLAGVAILSFQCFAIVATARLITCIGLLSSAWNHRVWVCAIILLIGLVPACFYLPNGLIAKIPIPSPRQSQAETPFQNSSNPTLFPVTDQTGNEPAMDQIGESRVSAASVESNDQATRTPVESSLASASQQSHSAIAITSIKPINRLYGLLLWIYFVGAAFLISRLVVGWVRLKSLGNGAASLERSSLEIARELAEKLELRRLPVFAVSSNVVAPMSWGILKPHVLLPKSFDEWSQECRQAVLAHELSHIARRDSLFDLVSRISSTLYWFHPAIHYASRQIESAREEATDERVLACGILPETYARQLIEVLERCTLSRTCFLPTAVSMAKSKTLESRIRRILAKRHKGLKPWRNTRRFALVLTAVCLLVVSMPFRLVSGVPVNNESGLNPTQQLAQADPKQSTPLSLFQRFQKVEVQLLDKASETFPVEGSVVGPDGEPVSNAIVLCYPARVDHESEIVGKTTTDSAGRYTLTRSRNSIQSDASFTKEILQVVAVDSDNRLGWAVFEAKENVRELPIRLTKCINQIEGVVLAPSGLPLPSVEVEAFLFFSNGVFRLSVDGKLIDFKTKTDADGRFTLNGLPTDVAYVRLNSADWEVLPSCIDNSPIQSEREISTNYGRVKVLQNPVVLNAYPSVQLSARVVDSKGIAIAGASIAGNGTSDADGHLSVRLPEIVAWEPTGDREVNVEITPPKESSFLSTFLTVTSEQISKREMLTVVCEGEWVSGKIMSAVTKKPLPNIRVRTKPQSASNKEVVSDSDGKFRILVKPGQIDLEFLPGGLLWEEERQFLTESSRRRASRQFDIVAGEQADAGTILLNYLTSENKPIAIQVTMADGQPAANCMLRLFHRGALNGNAFQASLRDLENVVANIKTDQNGLANIQPSLDWEKDNLLFASYPASKPTHFGFIDLKSGTIEVVPLRLEEAARVTGKVSLNGEPLRGATVLARLTHMLPRALMPSVQFESSKTDVDGRYVLNVIPNAWYQLDIRLDQAGTSYNEVARVFGPKQGIENVVAEIALVSGNEEIRGKVVDEMGNKVPDVNVSLKLDSRLKNLIGAGNYANSRDGEFRFTGLPSGTYELTAELNLDHFERRERRMAGKQPPRSAVVEATAGQNNVLIVLPVR